MLVLCRRNVAGRNDPISRSSSTTSTIPKGCIQPSATLHRSNSRRTTPAGRSEKPDDLSNPRGALHNSLIAQEVCRFTKMVEESQGQVDHFPAARAEFRSPAKPREIVSDIAVILLDPEDQVLASEELRLGDAVVVAVRVVGQEDRLSMPILSRSCWQVESSR